MAPYSFQSNIKSFLSQMAPYSPQSNIKKFSFPNGTIFFSIKHKKNYLFQMAPYSSQSNIKTFLSQMAPYTSQSNIKKIISPKWHHILLNQT
jgi:uncharacterized protein YneF (UPF0154 family)